MSPATLSPALKAAIGEIVHVADERAGGSGAGVKRIVAADGRILFLKAGEGAAAEGIVAEHARLRWLQGRAPVAAMAGFAHEDDRAWLLTAALPGRSAGDWLAQDDGALSWVIAGLAGYLRDMHALPVAECPFDASVAAWLPDARARVAAGLVDEEDFDDDHRGWGATRVLAKVEALAGAARGRVVAHGDFTLGNVILDAGGRVTGCIDVGRLGVADPYQDIALCWRDLGGFGAGARAAFRVGLGIEAPDERRMLLHRALDELF